ncbi:MAG: type II toxin-antitoxin system HicB family antitoxin [Crocosphaera sp.]
MKFCRGVLCNVSTLIILAKLCYITFRVFIVNDMKQSFTARIFSEGDWFVAQCLDIDIASQGKTETEALTNLQEALELHFEPPCATVIPELQKIEVEINAA